MRLVLALLLLALAVPAQAQDRFFQACVASAAGEDLPPGMDPSAICGCATQQAARAGAAPAALDRLADHVPAGGGALDMDALPADLRPAAEASLQAMMGCVLQLGLAGAMEEAGSAVAEGMAEAMSAALTEAATGMAEGMEAAVAEVAAPGAAPAEATAEPTVMRNGIPPQLAARMAAARPDATAATPAVAPAPTVTPDGTVASAPTPRTTAASGAGFRTGSGRPAVQTVQSGKGAAIRIVR